MDGHTRPLTPAQRLATMERLYWTAREIKAAGLRAAHPDWPEDRIQAEVRRVFLRMGG